MKLEASIRLEFNLPDGPASLNDEADVLECLNNVLDAGVLQDAIHDDCPVDELTVTSATVELHPEKLVRAAIDLVAMRIKAMRVDEKCKFDRGLVLLAIEDVRAELGLQ